jgi:uncharacterized protein (TIGR02646 family)
MEFFMIRVNRSNVLIPPELDGPDSDGMKEREEAIRFYTNPNWNGNDSFSFKVYKKAKEALNELFHFKCAYCESKYEATAPVDVEHYRPKASVKSGGIERKPGYYWLAASWDNLLPSCINCNRGGKRTLFPIENEADRATAPGEDHRERPLLIDPCRDDPQAHLEFIEEGVVRPKLTAGNQPDPKGMATIEVCKLQRPGLRNMRRDRLMIVLAQITRVTRVTNLLNNDPEDPEANAWIQDELQELDRLQQDGQEYAGMARQFAERLLDTFR